MSSCLVDGENKRSEITERVTTEKPRNLDEEKTKDEGYLFQNYIKGRSSLPIPCASNKVYSKQNE